MLAIVVLPNFLQLSVESSCLSLSLFLLQVFQCWCHPNCRVAMH
jgi:hypothetical protein